MNPERTSIHIVLKTTLLSMTIFIAALNGYPTNPQTLAQQNFYISIDDSGYVPNTLFIPLGSIVTWTNHGTTAHTVTSQQIGKFDSLTLAPGASFSFTFNTPGIYPYWDRMNTQHTGQITVT